MAGGGGGGHGDYGGGVSGGVGGLSDSLSTPFLTPPPPQVDLSYGYSYCHFSWRHDGSKKYTWYNANNYYYQQLGYGGQGVSIESPAEDAIISKVIHNDNLKYIWMGGYKQGSDFVWLSGKPSYGLRWSHTGKLNEPQPDNAEDGNEDCLWVLNDFYDDDIKWHDIACHHVKPIICERPHTYGSHEVGFHGDNG